MLEGLYQIGLVQDFNILEDLTLDIDENKYKYIIKIQFKKENDYYDFYKIDFEHNSSYKKKSYCLVKGPSNGASRTPITLCPLDKKFFKNGRENIEMHIDDIIEKKFRNKILPSINSFIENYYPENNYLEELKKIDKTLNNKKDFIENELKNFLINNEQIRNENDAILISFFINGEEIYPGDFPPIFETLKKNSNEVFIDYYKKNDLESKSKNKYCFYCHSYKEEVWGYGSPFTFYTVDKKSFVSGGFKQEFAWKNYPVCPDCAIKLHIGKKYLLKNLRFNFAGYNYLLIPQLLFFNEEQMKELLKRLESYSDFSLSDKFSSRIDKIEEYIIRKLSEENQIVNFNFLFYEVKNSAFNILLLIQEIPPSRMKELIKKKDETDEKYKTIFQEKKTKKDIIDFNFHFDFIFEFFKGGKYDIDFKKNAMEILRNIFYLKPISFNLLLDRFLSKIRSSFCNNDEFYLELYILKALKIVLYFEEIKILDRRRYRMEGEKPFEDFLILFPILDESTKRAVFLEGVLALKLLNIQFQQKGAKPFYSRLNGLKIDEKVAKRLLPEMINKLEEYDKNYYKDLESAIGYYFTQSNFNNFTVDELSFYFALGLSLGKLYRKEEEEEKND